MDALIDIAAVARRLGRSRSWFYEHRKELERQGFPAPLPIVDRWDPAAVDAWIAGCGRMAQAVQKDHAKRALDAAFGL